MTLLGTAIGVKGQSLSEEACPRLLERARCSSQAAGRSRAITLAADGGIRENTVPRLRAAGAQTVVLGSLAFGAPDLAARTAWLHGFACRMTDGCRDRHRPRRNRVARGRRLGRWRQVLAHAADR